MRKLIVGIGLLVAGPSLAGVSVTDCVIVEPIANKTHTALYFNVDYTLNNDMKALRLPSPEAILGGEISTLSDHVEMHKTIMDNGVMKMAQVPKIFLNENSRVSLEKGGLHFMLFDLKKRPIEGESYPVNIWFSYLGDVQCTADVLKVQNL